MSLCGIGSIRTNIVSGLKPNSSGADWSNIEAGWKNLLLPMSGQSDALRLILSEPPENQSIHIRHGLSSGSATLMELNRAYALTPRIRYNMSGLVRTRCSTEPSQSTLDAFMSLKYTSERAQGAQSAQSAQSTLCTNNANIHGEGLTPGYVTMETGGVGNSLFLPMCYGQGQTAIGLHPSRVIDWVATRIQATRDRHVRLNHPPNVWINMYQMPLVVTKAIACFHSKKPHGTRDTSANVRHGRDQSNHKPANPSKQSTTETDNARLIDTNVSKLTRFSENALDDVFGRVMKVWEKNTNTTEHIKRTADMCKFVAEVSTGEEPMQTESFKSMQPQRRSNVRISLCSAYVLAQEMTPLCNTSNKTGTHCQLGASVLDAANRERLAGDVGLGARVIMVWSRLFVWLLGPLAADLIGAYTRTGLETIQRKLETEQKAFLATVAPKNNDTRTRSWHIEQDQTVDSSPTRGAINASSRQSARTACVCRNKHVHGILATSSNGIYRREKLLVEQMDASPDDGKRRTCDVNIIKRVRSQWCHMSPADQETIESYLTSDVQIDVDTFHWWQRLVIETNEYCVANRDNTDQLIVCYPFAQSQDTIRPSSGDDQMNHVYAQCKQWVQDARRGFWDALTNGKSSHSWKMPTLTRVYAAVSGPGPRSPTVSPPHSANVCSMCLHNNVKLAARVCIPHSDNGSTPPGERVAAQPTVRNGQTANMGWRSRDDDKQPKTRGARGSRATRSVSFTRSTCSARATRSASSARSSDFTEFLTKELSGVHLAKHTIRHTPTPPNFPIQAYVEGLACISTTQHNAYDLSLLMGH